MVRNKKIKYIFLGSSIITASVATTTLSFKKDNNYVDKEFIKKVLEDLNYNIEYISKIEYSIGNKIFENLRNNKSVNDLIYSLSFDISKTELIDEIYKLKLKEDEVRLLIYKISSHFSSIKNNSKKTSTITYIEKKEVFGINENLVNGVKIVDENFEEIKGSGYHHSYSIDNFFDDDVSYIHWTNRDIFEYFFYKNKDNIEKNLAEFLESNLNDMKDTTKKDDKKDEKKNIFTINFPSVSNRRKIYVDLRAVTKTINQINKLISKSKTIQAIKELVIMQLKQWSPSFGSNSVSSKILNSKAFDFLNKKTGITLDNMKTKAINSLSVATLVFNAASIQKSLINAAKKHNLDSKTVYDITGNIIKVVKSALILTIGSTGVGLPVAVGIELAYDIFDAIIKTTDLGNGYTIYENFNDHGLNDWDFQMKNNEETMYKIAFNFSNNFKNGVVWKVTDGWFSYPELYIAPTNENNALRVEEPDTSLFEHLSPGTSFNFGNKIEEIIK